MSGITIVSEVLVYTREICRSHQKLHPWWKLLYTHYNGEISRSYWRI